MIPSTSHDDPIRRKIERLGSSLSLPTVHRALGILEGEHPSGRAPGNGDFMDIRPYTTEDEARSIDWTASARMGRPVAVRRERMATSRVWMLLDTGREMTGTCADGEKAFTVAANALCLVAALSLRRFDDISFVTGDSHSIVRMPFHGTLPRFEAIVDSRLRDGWDHPRDVGALVSYANRIADRRSLVIIATDAHAITDEHIQDLARVAHTHPLLVVSVSTANPLRGHRYRLSDGRGRRIPAFMIDPEAADEIDARRAYSSARLDRELTHMGARHVQADSSQTMFDRLIHEVSRALAPARSGSGFADASSWRRT